MKIRNNLTKVIYPLFSLLLLSNNPTNAQSLENSLSEEESKIKDEIILVKTGRYTEAEKFMRKAITLMPNDPIVNDHYGDILWSLNKKIQAKYYCNSVIRFKDTEKDMLEKVKKKLLVGPNIDNNNSYN